MTASAAIGKHGAVALVWGSGLEPTDHLSAPEARQMLRALVAAADELGG